jgi:integrase
MLQRESDREMELQNIDNVLHKIYGQDWRLGAVCRIMFWGGFRVSEVLDVRSGDIDRQGGVLVRGKKGSNDRYFFDSALAPDLLKLRACGGMAFFGINRFRVYRALKHHGISRKMQGRKYSSVCHLGRHIKAEKLRSVGADNNTIGVELSHKNTKNSEHYGDK